MQLIPFCTLSTGGSLTNKESSREEPGRFSGYKHDVTETYPGEKAKEGHSVLCLIGGYSQRETDLLGGAEKNNWHKLQGRKYNTGTGDQRGGGFSIHLCSTYRHQPVLGSC